MPMRLHGGIDVTQIKHVWQGDWLPGQIYYLNDVIRYHGQSFVCVTSVLGDERRYGKLYQPTVANAYWQPFSNGYLIKGTWSYKEYYYPGDVIRYNDDWYLCNTYNWGGHPIYENGGLSTKWTKLAASSRANKQNNHLWMAGYNPMGWTYNCHETPDQFWSQNIHGFLTINGNYEASYIGRGTSGYGFGSEALSGSFPQQTNAGYDFWDYYDGYRPSITGGMPKCIQVVGGWYKRLFLFDNGEIYTLGYGGNGQSGDGTSTSYHFSRRVGRSSEGRGGGILRDVFIVKVASAGGLGGAGMSDYEHCAALDNTGQVWMWGYNGYGGLGNGTTNNLTSPTKIDRKFFDNAKIVDMWCTGSGSYQCTYALDQNGQLWAWGYNGYGVLGIGEYYTNVASGTDYTARPQKVQMDFTKYGGIKKFIPGSAGNAKMQIVLTNDNHLWSWGYSSYAAGWGYGANDTAIVRPRKLADLIQENANSLGIDQRKSVGSLCDVVANCDEFWSDDGSTADTENLIIKERQTGLIFGLGRRVNRSMPYLRGTMYQYSNSDNPLYDDDNTNPVMASIGDFKDLKYVIRSGSGADSRSYAWLNRDGRVMITGGDADNTSSGIGLNYSSQPMGNACTLPWEFDLTNGKAGGGAQVRWSDRIDMITGYWDFGIGAITKNHRFVFWGTGASTYGLTPYNQLIAATTQICNSPVRLLT